MNWAGVDTADCALFTPVSQPSVGQAAARTVYRTPAVAPVMVHSVGSVVLTG